MSRNTSFTRKVIYATCVAVLLYPLFYLGQPPSRDSKGGRLAQIRSEQGIAQSELGDIDPASETMRLATLGLRGVAVTMLWEKANEYKKKKDWENLSATVQQIIKLQPNYISVWEFQGHNLAYNVSVEFDDYRHRYEWVKRGTEFLLQGSQYNRDEPGLIWYIGWVIGQKFGRADEHRQFRRMFRADEDFHLAIQEKGQVPVDSAEARGPDGRPDNWLVSRLWYEKGIAAVRAGKPLRRKSPLVYYTNAFMQRINHALAIEAEGVLDEKAQIAWQRAQEDWNRFGDLLIPSTWGHNVRLNEVAKFEAERKELAEQLEALVPEAREKLTTERSKGLTDEERAAMAVPYANRTMAQHMTAESGRMKTQVTYADLADNATDEHKTRAMELAKRLVELEDVYINHTNRYRDQVNYGYWQMRCEVEQTKTATEARKHLYEANRYLDEVNPDAARTSFELAWEKWAELLEQYPLMMNEETISDLTPPMKKYMEVLGQLDLKLPEDFKLRKVWEAQQRQNVLPPGATGLPGGAGLPDAGANRGDVPLDDAPAAKPAPKPDRGSTEKPGSN